jgi:hypothetical protein
LSPIVHHACLLLSPIVIVPGHCCPWSSPIIFIPAHHCPLSLSPAHHCHWSLSLAPAKPPASHFVCHGCCPVVVLVIVVPHHCCCPPVVNGHTSLSAPPSPLQAVAHRLGGGAVSGYQSVYEQWLTGTVVVDIAVLLLLGHGSGVCKWHHFSIWCVNTTRWSVHSPGYINTCFSILFLGHSPLVFH